VTLASLCLWPFAAIADDHLVTAQAGRARLAEAAIQRGHDLDSLGRVLSRPEASAIVSGIGLSPDRVQARLATLSDRDLRDLAARAEALDRDVVAGHYTDGPDVHDLVVVLLVVVIVAVVLDAAD
jgi:hypothetical protein